MASKLKLTELLYPTSTTPAITINADDSVTIPTQSTTNLAYTGTLTGGTGVVNIGSGQIYKDASGNVGIGTSSPGAKLDIVNGSILLSNTYALVWKDSGGTARQILQYFSDNSLYIDAPNGSTVFRNGASNTEKMRIDSSGNVGIGINNPSQKLYVEGSIVGKSNDNYFGNFPDGAYVDIGNLGTSEVYIETRSNVLANINLNFRAKGSASHVFNTNSIERMRIDPSGNLLVGASADIFASGRLQVTTSSFGVNVSELATDGGGTAFAANRTSSDGWVAGWYRAGSGVGSIAVTSTTTTYNTTSDYRLKENVAPMTGALATVAALKPVTYTWKADGSAGQGFIAHELQAVVPDAVTGEKDALNKDGKPQYQGVDTSFLVGVLTAAIQEQQAIIQNLTTRLTALEGN
jgi:hypothetical protein